MRETTIRNYTFYATEYYRLRESAKDRGVKPPSARDVAKQLGISGQTLTVARQWYRSNPVEAIPDTGLEPVSARRDLEQIDEEVDLLSKRIETADANGVDDVALIALIKARREARADRRIAEASTTEAQAAAKRNRVQALLFDQ